MLGLSGDGERKRKHQEIVSDTGSASEEDIANFDYSNYESEEDPDYVVSTTRKPNLTQGFTT